MDETSENEPPREEMHSVVPVCYRHPGRETRLSCSECGRPICPDCSHDAVVGQKCPECAAPEHRTRVYRARDLRRVGWQRTPVTYAILAGSVALFLLGFLSPEIERSLLENLAQINFLVEAGEWWRVFSAALLHANLFHILFNMYALYLFGPRLEREAGSVPFALAYVAAAAAGGAAFFELGQPLSIAVGASGAIFGLFGIWLAATWRIRHTAAGGAMFNQLVFLLAINAALPLLTPRIAWQAHLGGLVAGVIIGLAWAQFAAGRPNAGQIRAAIAVAVGVAALLVVLVG